METTNILLEPAALTEREENYDQEMRSVRFFWDRWGVGSIHS